MKKDDIEKGKKPKREAPPPMSPGGGKIVSVTEEVFETVETKPGNKKQRFHIDDISAPEYFTKG